MSICSTVCCKSSRLLGFQLDIRRSFHFWNHEFYRGGREMVEPRISLPADAALLLIHSRAAELELRSNPGTYNLRIAFQTGPSPALPCRQPSRPPEPPEQPERGAR